MFGNALFIIFVVISTANICFMGLYLAGANLYDISQFRRHYRPVKKPAAGPAPLVTVIIPAHNESKAIARCLSSVIRSTKRKLQIIVVDDYSSDNTKRLVRQFMADHPNKDISLMYRQKNMGKAMALNHALHCRANGEFIMTLDADSVIHRESIANALRYFEDPRVAGVAANVRIMDSQTILGLLQKFEHLVGYRSKKLHSVLNCEFIVGGVASTFRASVLKQVHFYDDDTQTEDIGLSMKITTLGNKQHRLVYGVDVLAMTEGVQSFKALIRQRYRWKLGSLQNLIKYRGLFLNGSSKYTKSLTLYRIPVAFVGEVLLLMEPLAIGYLAYLCYQIMNPVMIVGAYMTISLYLLWNVWPDEHMSAAKKLRLSSYVPVMYFIFYLMNIVQLAAILNCLIHYRSLLRRSRTQSVWVSACRDGQSQVQYS